MVENDLSSEIIINKLYAELYLEVAAHMWGVEQFPEPGCSKPNRFWSQTQIRIDAEPKSEPAQNRHSDPL